MRSVDSMRASHAVAAPSAPPSRFAMLDGLRGFAALWVACFHIFGTGRSIHEIVPRPLAFVLEHGNLGVPVFYVLSGFAIAWSLRGVSLDRRAVGRFLLRRSIRLDPPYWATIALALAALAFSNVILEDRHVPAPPIWHVVAHVLYLPDLIGVPKILDVFWTLFIEMQFYLFFVLQLWMAQALSRRSTPGVLLVFLPFALASIAASTLSDTVSWHGTFAPFWWFYFLGVCACWVHEGQLGARWMLALLIAAAAGVVARPDAYRAAAVFTGCFVFTASKTGGLERWLNSRALQYLGKVSYSLYLVHQVAGQRLANLGFRVLGESRLATVICTLFALGCALLAAHALWWAVERPSIGLARRIRVRGSPVERGVSLTARLS